MNSFDDLVKELDKKSDKTQKDILSLVNNKYSEMQGLITKEGAAYLVAKDLNISLSGEPRRMQIKDITPGMRNISILGRIFKISKINEFRRSNGETGKVSNIFIGDKTGSIRMPLWDEQVKAVEEGVINLGDVIQVNNGMSKENIFGGTEISLGRFGSINHAEDFTDLPSLEKLSNLSPNSLERTAINSLVIGGNFEIKGTIVQFFKGNYLFSVCPSCDSKVEDNKCNEHGEVSPKHALILSFVVSDDTSDIRCVLFRETGEKFCGFTADELAQIEPDERYESIKRKILGKEMILIGRVKKNKFFERPEMVLNEFKDINALEESKELVEKFDFAGE